MYFFFILFFVSLAAITFMIVSKLVLIKNQGENKIIDARETFISEVLDFDKIKSNTIKNTKKFVHATVWIILRVYLISSNFINKKTKEIIKKIKSKVSKHDDSQEIAEKKEVSKYIKMIGEYRQKIKKIKHKIKEQEGIE